MNSDKISSIKKNYPEILNGYVCPRYGSQLMSDARRHALPNRHDQRLVRIARRRRIAPKMKYRHTCTGPPSKVANIPQVGK